MKALTYHGPRDIRHEDVPDPALRAPDDALVRVARASICGSDLHLYHGLTPAEAGFAVGHEFVGVVEEAGPEVRGAAVGDRVLVACTTGCGRCAMCRRGLASGCRITTAGGAQNVFGFSAALPGGQAEAVRVPHADANLFRIPDALSFEQALFLTDILPTGTMGAELAEVGPGDLVVVLGAGPVGVFAARAAELRGAARIVAVDLDETRLEAARARGFEAVHGTRDDTAARVRALSDGLGADAVIEAVGRPELVLQALDLARPGGRVAAIGVSFETISLPAMLLMLKNLTLRSGIVSPQAHVPRLLPLIASGRLDPTEVITHRLPLTEGPRAYELFDARADGVLKIVLEP